MTKHDPRLMENSAKVADECGIVDGERCDQAYKFTDCFHSGFKRDHVDIEIVWERLEIKLRVLIRNKTLN